jgi:hypothetical protein
MIQCFGQVHVLKDSSHQSNDYNISENGMMRVFRLINTVGYIRNFVLKKA